MSERLKQSTLVDTMQIASAGSFPLSQGVMTGHSAVANLFRHHYASQLDTLTYVDYYANYSQTPPPIRVPEGHRDINPDSLNQRVWTDFIHRAFDTNPTNPDRDFQDLIQINANSDVVNFTLRLAREKSRFFDNPTPSLLRAFVYEGKFPFKGEFFDWVFTEMRKKMNQAVDKNFTDDWSQSLQILIDTWNTHYPQVPFIPHK